MPKLINLSKHNDRLSGRGLMFLFYYRASVLGDILELDVILSDMLCHISCVWTSMLIPIRIDAQISDKMSLWPRAQAFDGTSQPC